MDGWLAPWAEEPSGYARMASRGYATCEDAVVAQCRELLDPARLDRMAHARLKAIREVTLNTLSGDRLDPADTPRKR